MKHSHPLWQTWMLVAFGGAVGAVARFGISRWLSTFTAPTWPWPTFLINASGSLILGFLSGWSWVQGAWNGRWWPLVAVGFLGAYTTFSTFSVETLQLIQRGAVMSALVYGTISPLMGLMAAIAGYGLAQLL